MKNLLACCSIFAAWLSATAEEVEVLNVKSGSHFSGYVFRNGSFADFHLLAVVEPQSKYPEVPSRESKLYLNRLIGGGRVDVEMWKVPGQSQVFAIVTSPDNKLINIEMIKSGYGLCDPAHVDSKILREAQDSARRGKRGLWPDIEKAIALRQAEAELEAKKAARIKLEYEKATKLWEQAAEPKRPQHEYYFLSELLDAIIPGVDYDSDFYAKSFRRIANGNHYVSSYAKRIAIGAEQFHEWGSQPNRKPILGRLYAISGQEKNVSFLQQDGEIITLNLDTSLLTIDEVSAIHLKVRYYHMLLESVFLRSARDQFNTKENEQIIESWRVVRAMPGHKKSIFNGSMYTQMIGLFANTYPVIDEPEIGARVTVAAYQSCLQGKAIGRSLDDSLAILNDVAVVNTLYKSALRQSSEAFWD